MTEINFSEFPPEILSHIFSFFTQDQLLLAIAQVCRVWHDIVYYDPALWKTVTFDLRNAITSQHMEACFHRMPLLRKLEVVGSRYADFELSAVDLRSCSRLCPNVSDLQLRFLPNVDLDLVDEIVRLFPNLCRLNLEGCERVNLECISRICDLPNVRALNISHCTLLTDDAIELLATRMAHLQELNIDGLNNVHNISIKMLVFALGNQLRHLCLDGENLTDSSIEILTTCHKLDSLTISFSQHLTDVSLRYLQAIPTLRKLGLRKGSQFTACGLASLFSGTAMSCLEYLELSECSLLDDLAVLSICKCCGSGLRIMHLSWCWLVTDVGFGHIVDHCRSLRHLDVVGLDKLTGLECLPRIAVSMPWLLYLDLRQCNHIIDHAVQELTRLKPNLTAINYYGESFSLTD